VVDLLGELIEEGEYNRYRRGIGVAPGNVDAFAAGLSRLIHDQSLREELGARGLEFVHVNYSKQRLIEDIKGLYGELTARRSLAAQQSDRGKYAELRQE
jgi:glycosyltransferase involved in cell wall biosynthesis